MDSEKIVRLTAALKYMTLRKRMEWSLDNKNILLYINNREPDSPSDIRCVFSSPVDDKIFRLTGVS
ncbi:MAG: hypothetical protein LBU34_17260, partial [Planctomycetaceae bacterium]|nr:hypothetical protein [Planctomycetaceae bacterium]